MLVEEKRPAVIHAQCLERGASPEQRFVVGTEHRLAHVDEAATRHGDREDVHALAASRGRAFTHDSSTSASGSESHTIPPPTQRWSAPSTAAKGRPVGARTGTPIGDTGPSATL